MSNRTLIRGGQVISQDPGIGILPKGDVLIEDDRIAAIAPALSAPADSTSSAGTCCPASPH